VFLHVTDDPQSVQTAIDDAERYELALVESLIEQIKNPDVREFWTDYDGILLNDAMERAARRHRDLLVREFGEPEQLPSGVARRIFRELDKRIVRHGFPTLEAVQIINVLVADGLATGEDLSRALLHREEDVGLTTTNCFFEVMEYCRRAVWFDEERESPPFYPRLVDMLAANSMGTFRPEAVLQWKGDVRSFNMPRFSGSYKPYVLVQYIHDQRLFRAALQDQGDWTDTDGFLLFINAPFEVNNLDRRFYAAETRDQGGGACLCFGEQTEIESAAARFNIRMKDQKASSVVLTNAMPPIDEFVLDNRWDWLRELFEDCDFDTPSQQLVRMRNKRYETLLHLCVRKGEIADVRLILDAGADVNAGDADGDTPLHLCREQIIDTLVDAGASPCIYNCQGHTILHSLADGGDTKKLEYLLHRYSEWNINLSTKDPDPEWRNAMEELLPNRSRKERHLRSGQTAMHRAAFHGRKDVCLLLLRHGADPSIRDFGGCTPDDLAEQGGHGDLCPIA